MARSLVGVRIREQRRHLKIRQADLARRVGISPSYMNLIERNKRGIAGALLRRIGEELNLSIEVLTGTAEQRLEADLIELARDPERGDPSMDAGTAGEFIGRFPGWARALGRISRRELAARSEVAALSDRLTHDPFLSQAVHAMLTDIAALRSTADILTDVEDIDRKDRDRFQRNISALAERLANTGSSLANYFDAAETEIATRHSDIDQLEDFLSTGDEVLQSAEQHGGRIAEDGFPDVPPARGGDGRLPGSTGRLWLAVRQHIANTQELFPAASADLPDIVREALFDRAADAAIAPITSFRDIADQLGWDLQHLIRAYDGETALVFRRISAIPDLRLAYLKTDASGRTLARLGALDQLPRHYDAACPKWAVHHARLQPGRAIHQLVRFPDGSQRLFIAMADPDSAESFQLSGDPAALPNTITAPARQQTAPQPVGATCQLCAHADCSLRREPPVVDLAVSPLQSA